MVDFALSLVVLTVALGVLLAATRGLPRARRRMLLLALAAKTVAAVALMWVMKYYYGYGDMLSFLRQGHGIVRYLEYSGFSGLQDVIAVIFQQEVQIPVRLQGVGRTTGTMSALSGLLLYILPSDWAVSIAFAMMGFAGQVALTIALWKQVLDQHWKVVAISCLFVPSLAFWSAGVVKETLAIGGLGLFTLSLAWLLEKRVSVSVVVGLAGVALIWLSKPFVLLALACGVAAGGYVWRSSRSGGGVRIRPVALAFWVVLGFAALFAIGEVFPRYAIANMAEQVAIEQSKFERVSGGSDFEVESFADRSLLEQVLFSPIALVTSWFRPFVFEAENVVMLANAFESTVFLVLFLLVFRRNGFRLVGRVLSSPTLSYALVIACVLGMGVGLTTTNMGSLSRYRIPMLPFFVLWLLVLSRKPLRNGAPQVTREPLSLPRPPSLGNSVRS